jgi:putative aldouronate transport system permease protein
MGKAPQAELLVPAGKQLHRALSRYWMQYLMILPGIVLLFVFAYIPMAGVLIAFQDYKVKSGMTGFLTSRWVGLENFGFLKDPYFWITVGNTLKITVYRLVVTWPLPIIMAVMLNEVRWLKYKRVAQTISYLPYFISWIIAAYMITSILALDTGIVNVIQRKLNMEQVYFMGKPEYFGTIAVVSNAWKVTGWGTIMYLAALSNVDVSLQEAAKIDGAGRLRRIWHISLPCIRPTIVILLILNMPSILSAGYEQIMPLQNPANMAASDVLDIYIMRLGLVQGKYSRSTAIGLVLAVLNMTLVLLSNKAAKWLGNDGLF